MLWRKSIGSGKYIEVRVKVIWGVTEHFLEARNSWTKEVDGGVPKISGRDRMGKKLVVTCGSVIIISLDTLEKRVQFSSVAQSRPALCDPMDCSTPGFPVLHQLLDGCSNSCPLSRWCHPAISSSVVPFSFCPQSFPASGSFPKSHFFASGDQSIRASASASRQAYFEKLFELYDYFLTFSFIFIFSCYMCLHSKTHWNLSILR